MKKAIILIVVALAVIAGYLYFDKTNDTSVCCALEINNDPSEEENIARAISVQKTEDTACTATIPSRCYVYRCSTGYIYMLTTPPPGGTPFACTDGSRAEIVGEVPNTQ